MTSSRTQPNKFPTAFEFQLLLHFSISELSLFCAVSKMWHSAASHLELWKIALQYRKPQNAMTAGNWTGNFLLRHLIHAIGSQNIQLVHRLIGLGVDLKQSYRGRVDLASLNAEFKNDPGFFIDPNPLVIAAATSSETKGGDIVHILVSNGANVLQNSTFHLDEKRISYPSIFNPHVPSKFAIRNPTVQKFLKLKESEAHEALPEPEVEYYGDISSSDICCLVTFIGIPVSLGLIGALIICPVLTGSLLGLLVLAYCLPPIISSLQETISNYNIRRKFHNQLSEDKEPPKPVKFYGGLFSKLWQPTQNNPQLNSEKENNSSFFKCW